MTGTRPAPGYDPFGPNRGRGPLIAAAAGGAAIVLVLLVGGAALLTHHATTSSSRSTLRPTLTPADVQPQ